MMLNRGLNLVLAGVVALLATPASAQEQAPSSQLPEFVANAREPVQSSFARASLSQGPINHGQAPIDWAADADIPPESRLRSPTALGFGIGIFAHAASHVGIGLELDNEDCKGSLLCLRSLGTPFIIGGSIAAAGGIALMVIGGTRVDVDASSEEALAVQPPAPLQLRVAAGPSGLKLLGEF